MTGGTVVVLTVLIMACIVDIMVNKFNPTPKMRDRDEEKKFHKTICKTRKLFECTLR